MMQTTTGSRNRGHRLLAAVLTSMLVRALVFAPFIATPLNAAEDFENYEIRVIRPKFFSKTGRLELGAQMTVIMNQTFIYTYLATGILVYHFSEQLALEGSGAFGFSIDKDDKTLLKSDFGIETQILRTQYIMEGALLYTPIYGKYQLTSGRMIYFDTFLAAGACMTGVEYNYEWCVSAADLVTKPAAKTVPYPTFMVGIGQRFFLDKKLSLRWDVRDHIFQPSAVDASCDPSSGGSSVPPVQNVTMQLGVGYFL